MQLKPEEISKVIRSQIKYYENAIRQDETGTVLMVGDGIARASGLSNCMAGELLEFEDGSYGMAQNLEETLQTAVVKAINELLANKEPFLQALQKNIATILNEENDNATNDIDSKLEELQQQLLIQAKSKNDYEDVADEIYHLRELKQNALVENAEREGKRQRIAEMTDFFNEQSCELEEYDEQLVRRLIEKVTVFHDKFAVEFKSGVEIDVEG